MRISKMWLLAMAVALWSCSQGDKGSTGAPGEKGDKGDSGAQGAKGDIGAQGAKGDPGAQGAKGDPGTAGDAGPAGSTGTQGAQGPAGHNGDAGPQGPEGMTFVLTERAAKGLDVSPVSANIQGKSSEEVEQIGIGSYLVNTVADCGGCHNSPDQKFLAGGAPFPLDASGHVVYTRNLTPDATTGMKLTEDQFITAFRTGQDFAIPTTAAAQQMIVMPWIYFRWMSTPDIKAVYAYLKSIPAVNNVVTADNKGPTLSALAPAPAPTKYNDGDVDRPLPTETDVSGAPAPDPDSVMRGLAIRPLAAPTDLGAIAADELAAIGRGSYLANAIAHCSECHTNPARNTSVAPTDPAFMRVNTAHYLSGGGVFAVPPPLAPIIHQTRTMSADLTGLTHGFLNEADANFDVFLGIISSGQKIDETPAIPLGWPMPWDAFHNMTLSDLTAIWSYLKTLPAIAGTSSDAADKQTQGFAIYCAVNGDCPTGQTCATATNECVGALCATEFDCGACQTCTGGVCVAPAATDSCLTDGI